jgi:hypothetical protein
LNARRIGRTLAVAFAVAVASAFGSARASAATPSPSVAACDVVSADEVAAILGLAVQPADEASRTGGICFFATRGVSDEGSASYAIVTAADLPERRAFYSALVVECGGDAAVAATASRAAACATYEKLATASDLDAYFAARTTAADAVPVPDMKDAVSTGEAVYARRGPRVVEAVVERAQVLDLPRSTALAELVFAHLQP